MSAKSKPCFAASVYGHPSASSCSTLQELCSSSPARILSLLGGALFGPVWGTLWNLLGALLGATLAFLIARSVGAEWVAQRLGGRLRRLVEGVEAEGWRFVALMRLVPLVPFNLLNYALGLTRISLRAYILASAVCMLPGAVAYTWLCRPLGRRGQWRGFALRPAWSWRACHDCVSSPVVPPVSRQRTVMDSTLRLKFTCSSRRRKPDQSPW